MSSEETLQELVIGDSPRAPAIDPWDFTEVETIVDSWIPDSMGDTLSTDPTIDGRIPEPEHSVQLPLLAPPLLQSTEDVPAVMGGIMEERFTGLPSTTTGLELSISEVADQPYPRERR